jgi:predicted aconitase with swiveling domain
MKSDAPCRSALIANDRVRFDDAFILAGSISPRRMAVKGKPLRRNVTVMPLARRSSSGAAIVLTASARFV